jgi:KaiC/GvpD/RAD55 family RecA-like ATPase
MMFRNTINGLEKLLDMEIPQGSVILVAGAEGTLKSGLVFSMVSKYLAASGEHGLYLTLEQTKESHFKNMESLGLKKSDVLHVFDYRDVRVEWKNRELDMIKTTEEIIDFYKDKYGNLTVFALDSLNAIYSLSEEADLRKSMYYFFSNLRDEGLTSFLITEVPHLRASGQFNTYSRPESFLADGVIELGIIEGNGSVKRYIQILKMRAAKHAMEKHQLIVDEEGLSILGLIY